MTDYELFDAVRDVLLVGLADAGKSTVPVKQFNSRTIQGRPSGPCVLFQKLSDKRYGWPKRQDVPDPDNPAQMIHSETQFYESTIQIEAVGPPFEPGDSPTETPSDLVNLAAAIVQSDKAIAALRLRGLAVLRVTQVRNPFMQNDRDQFEAVPSFDLVVTREQVMLSTTPAAVVGELRMARV